MEKVNAVYASCDDNGKRKYRVNTLEIFKRTIDDLYRMTDKHLMILTS